MQMHENESETKEQYWNDSMILGPIVNSLKPLLIYEKLYGLKFANEL